jgi:hypothetical protein
VYVSQGRCGTPSGPDRPNFAVIDTPSPSQLNNAELDTDSNPQATDLACPRAASALLDSPFFDTRPGDSHSSQLPLATRTFERQKTQLRISCSRLDGLQRIVVGISRILTVNAGKQIVKVTCQALISSKGLRGDVTLPPYTYTYHRCNLLCHHGGDRMLVKCPPLTPPHSP